MKMNKDYSRSPAKNFDAVEDIKFWLGEKKYAEVSPQMAGVRDPKTFAFYCEMAGIQGFPVQAWYDLHHGEGAYLKACETEEKVP